MVSVLDIKVLRDIWSMRLQVLSIAMLVAAGVAVFVMSVSNYRALVGAMENHYRNERFADLFAGMTRAPLVIADRLREIDGIGIVEPRVAKPVRIIREDTNLPISGRIISLPADGQPLLNRLHLVQGRWPDPFHPEEVIINAAYAEARAVRIGDPIEVVLNGRLQDFRVVGSALSPEFVFATRSAVPLPDDRNFVVLWAGEDAVASAFDMKGAFNDVAMTIAPGASVQHVLEEVDRLLAPYGGTGAYDRGDQPSHRFLEDELAEQETLSIFMPSVFFGIAAFLLNVVIGRMVEAQRGQIASLKALGFANGTIALHYFKLVTAIALVGSAAGLVLGWWFAVGVVGSYRAFFRFPSLEARFEPWLLVAATLVSIVSANLAAATSVYRIAVLPPAEAMRPATPPALQTFAWLQTIGNRVIPLQYIIAARTTLGRPIRTLFSIIGIALAIPLILFGLYWFDAIDYMIDVSLSRVERGDAFLTFTEPVSTDARYELMALPGVLNAELQRVVPVRLRAGYRTYRTSAIGLDPGSELKIPRDKALQPISVPADGIMLSRQIAGQLDLHVGDRVSIEVLEGTRVVKDVIVRRISDDILGSSVTMDRSALNRVMKEGPVANVAALRIDPAQSELVWSRIKSMPRIEGSSVKALWLSLFSDTIGGMVLIGALILAGFGMLIAIGVVYNSARIALQERAWELAGLRIVGLTRHEVSAVVVSELVVELVVAIPLGLLIGRYLIELIASARASQSFQIPAVIDPSSYVIASVLVIAAAFASFIMIRRRIDALDLVAVLKTRD
ncbi:ABC transporter permease [Mesorhizobium sp. WSM4976]|uniref:ABC transporter permease n=1 Tax=Mesorhizobium sp. WSM4976 TaxID=3038549 RepID=UPI002416BBE2|nr:ABC transporter permease [Mesorhizobium sp. WSM4976]MDG4893566.1 ABC transporter permease [Mesorhizobium sp. WSM4976]